MKMLFNIKAAIVYFIISIALVFYMLHVGIIFSLANWWIWLAVILMLGWLSRLLGVIQVVIIDSNALNNYAGVIKGVKDKLDKIHKELLFELPDLNEDDMVECPKCKKNHKVKYGYDIEGNKSNEVLYVKCGEEPVVVGRHGKEAKVYLKRIQEKLTEFRNKNDNNNLGPPAI